MGQFSALLITTPPPMTPGVDGMSAAAKVDGRETLLRSVELFLNRDAIPQVQVCFAPKDLEEGKKKFGGHLGLFGVRILSGGPGWVDQAPAAAPRLADGVTHVIVHDAARPAVPYDDIDALLAAAEKAPAACLTTSLRSALIELDPAGAGVALHSPAGFVQMSLPMCFTRQRFEQIAADKKEPHISEYTLVKGSGLNVRVAGGHDAGLIKAMLNLLPKPKVKPPSSPFEEAQW